MNLTQLFTFGIDPDSKQHGVAIYEKKHLKVLTMMDTPGLIDSVRNFKNYGKVLVCIEHTDKNKFMYARNAHGNKAARSNIAMKVGKNQQAQLELCRWLDHHGFDYVLQKPSKRNWANDKKRFEQHTGWTGRSNVDTRSAAYFGFLVLPASKEIT